MVANARPRGTIRFWHIINPVNSVLAALAPWWVLLETTGRRSGRRRRIPLGAGPRDSEGMDLLSVHGRRADWVRNIEADPRVRLRKGFRWRTGTATVAAATPERLSRFNSYVRNAPNAFPLEGESPVIVRVVFG
ncbi:nitroreductase family deazaflavin-dependent oxidoreductase [Nocardia sp. 2]|uniref:Nitroreductase family deazaflavin-dependent oxidoreductase n=1 Tax=Nocardia acididurans TaxID=2802282 RepID=A0ABS1M8J9_9NOCA|nr:nitroreductase family deazaflavin-dependent oxidoreductase [Nocardia acididurans]MBL1076967.1 nitroreductase family deazaflavin-dependent oxidoreductase [Nocardia acididurans]